MRGRPKRQCVPPHRESFLIVQAGLKFPALVDFAVKGFDNCIVVERKLALWAHWVNADLVSLLQLFDFIRKISILVMCVHF